MISEGSGNVTAIYIFRLCEDLCSIVMASLFDSMAAMFGSEDGDHPTRADMEEMASRRMSNQMEMI